jgi:hypothetical protein
MNTQTTQSDAQRHLRDGLVLVYFDSDDLGVELLCWFDYEPPERGDREDGLQMSPDYPAMWTLCHVYLPGSNVDIAPVMSSGRLSEIEEYAAEGGEPSYF